MHGTLVGGYHSVFAGGISVQLGSAIVGADFWGNALKPGSVEAFEIAIPAGTLTSPKEGLDKNTMVATHLAFVRDRVLRSEYLREKVAANVKDAAVKKRFDDGQIHVRITSASGRRSCSP